MTRTMPRAATVAGRNATSLAWIPLRRRAADIHGFGGWMRQCWLWKPFRFLAIKLLFGSGNDPVPDAIWQDPDAFRAYLQTKEYRGALLLEQVTLHLDRVGRAVQITAVGLPELDHWGYTPMGVYCHGDGKVRIKTYCRQGTGFIDCRVYFRVGRLANVGALLLTGSRAPYAWMRLRYQLSADQDPAAYADGSFIPTQQHVIGTLGLLHPIEACDDSDVRRFMSAGDSVPAPRRGLARLL